MAGYVAANATLDALRQFFVSRLSTFSLDGVSVPPTVSVIGSSNFSAQLSGNLLAIYLHRIPIDPHGRSRSFPAVGAAESSYGTRELPINLHLLLITSGTPAMEVALMSWAMMQLANASHFDVSHLGAADPTFDAQELLTVIPEEMTTEDLMRIWDTLDAPYTTSVPYIARTVRLRLEEPDVGPPVVTRVFPVGTYDRADEGASGASGAAA